MKKRTIKPGFEFIFSLALMAILGLPPLVFAQGAKDEQISITNGDTTINGKNIKDLSAKDQQTARKDIGNIGVISADDKNNLHQRRDVIIERDTAMMANGRGGDRMMTFKRKHGMGKDSTLTLNFQMNTKPMHKGDDENRMEFRFNGSGNMPMMGFNRKNSQTFSYATTDNNGISTRINYRVSEPSGPVGHIEGESEPSQYELLDIKDLTLVPEFSAGTTTIAFSLLSKAPAIVRFKDSEGNILWTEKTVNGSFSKTFSMGLNGEYYLHIKQGGKIAVKMITKE